MVAAELVKIFKDDIKTLEDVQNKARNILRRQSMRGGGSLTEGRDEKFMRIVLGYHPTRKVQEG